MFPLSITSFRCSDTLVVAYTVLRDALVWGKCCDKVIKVPNVQPLDFPRDFFSRGPRKDTGGAVYPGWYLGPFQHLGADRKWPPFRSRNFQISLNENVRVSIKMSPKFVPKCPFQYIRHCLNQWGYWRIYASLGLNELNQYRSSIPK